MAKVQNMVKSKDIPSPEVMENGPASSIGPGRDSLTASKNIVGKLKKKNSAKKSDSMDGAAANVSTAISKMVSKR